MSHSAIAPGQHVPMRTVLGHLWPPLLMGAIMTFAYLWGFHAPSPRHLPVAVVGQASTPIADGLEQRFGDGLDVTVAADEATARDDLAHQRIAAAYVPADPRGTDATARLLVATGSSETTTNVTEKIFRSVAEKQGARLAIEDTAPLHENDPIGQNGFFYLVGLTIASYATSIAIGAAGATRRMRERALLALGASVVIPTVLVAIASTQGVFAGHTLTAWGLSVLYSLGVLLIGVGLHPIVGRFATVLYSALFVGFNFTSSGGVFAPTMQPALFAWLHRIWIGAGFIEAERRTAYFPLMSRATPVLTLLAWILVGLLAIRLGTLRERRHLGPIDARHALDADTEEEIEEASAVG